MRAYCPLLLSLLSFLLLSAPPSHADSLLSWAAPKRIAVYRPATGEWFLRGQNGSPVIANSGAPQGANVVPRPYDFAPDAGEEPVRVNLTTYEWTGRLPNGSATSVQWGGAGDVPVPANYINFPHQGNVAVYRPSTGEWLIRQDNGQPYRLQWGGPGDRPIPARYVTSIRAQVTVYRPASGEWFIRLDDGSALVIPWGGPGDVPMPGDYLGLGRDQVAVFRPATGEWFVRDEQGRGTRIQWGAQGDVPVPGDYLNRGRCQVAVYRPTTGEWFIRDTDGQLWRVQWGGPGDVPVPAAYAFPWFSASLAGTWRGTWTDALGDRGVIMIAVGQDGRAVGVTEDQTVGISTSISAFLLGENEFSGSYRYPGDVTISFYGALQMFPDGHLRGDAPSTAGTAPHSHLTLDITRYDLAGGSPFAGVWQGTWSDPSGYGDAILAVDRGGRTTGWIRHTPWAITGDVLGAVTALGAFSAQVRYPLDTAVILQGSVRRSGNRVLGDAAESQGGRAVGRLNFDLTQR